MFLNLALGRSMVILLPKSLWTSTTDDSGPTVIFPMDTSLTLALRMMKSARLTFPIPSFLPRLISNLHMPNTSEIWS